MVGLSYCWVDESKKFLMSLLISSIDMLLEEVTFVRSFELFPKMPCAPSSSRFCLAQSFSNSDCMEFSISLSSSARADIRLPQPMGNGSRLGRFMSIMSLLSFPSASSSSLELRPSYSCFENSLAISSSVILSIRRSHRSFSSIHPIPP